MNRAFMYQDVLVGEDLRTQFPSIAWQLLQVTPFGCGFGNTISFDMQGAGLSFVIQPTSTVWSGFNSFWLNLFSRLGVLGVVAFLILIVGLFRYVWTRAKMVEDRRVRAFLVGGMLGLASQWIVWLANNTFILPGGCLNYWFMMGMLVAGCRAFAPQPALVLVPVEEPFGDGLALAT